MNDYKQTVELTSNFWKLHERELQLREELDKIARDVRSAEKLLKETDEKVSKGSLFVDALRKAENELRKIKEKRNALSLKIQAADTAKEKYRSEITPELVKILTRQYDNVYQAQQNFVELRNSLRRIAAKVSHFSGLGIQPCLSVNSPLACGHEDLLTEKDIKYFESLKSGEESQNGK